MVEVKINLEKCTGCGTCVDICPVTVLEVKEGKCFVIRPEDCLACRACEVQCPEGAIEIIE